MRIIIVLILFIGCQSGPLFAQKSQELGVRFSNFRDFSAIYKKELKENKFLRIRNISSTIDYAGNTKTARLNIGAAIGYEMRKSINSVDNIIHGPEFGASFRFTKDTPTSIYYRASYLIGMNHRIGKSLIIGVEFTPSVIMSGVKDDFDYSALFNFSTVGITMAYAFIKDSKEKSM